MQKPVVVSDRSQDTEQPYMIYAYPGKLLANKFVCQLRARAREREREREKIELLLLERF